MVGRAEEEGHLLLGLDQNDDVARVGLYTKDEGSQLEVIGHKLTVISPSYLTSCRFPHQLLVIQKSWVIDRRRRWWSW